MLCLVTDSAASRQPLAASVERCVAAGVDWVQLRERGLEGAALLVLADTLRAAARRGAEARGGPVRFLVNRRADVALASGADGVHLGGDALPAARARALLGDDAWIGVSTHHPDEVAAAARAGASYAQLAPVFPPRSKPATRPALGAEALAAAAGHGLPVLAQGGITPENAGACLAAGAAGVAVTGWLLQAADPAAASAELRRALDRAAPAPVQPEAHAAEQET